MAALRFREARGRKAVRALVAAISVCRYNPVDRAPLSILCRDEVRIDRRYRQPAACRLRGIPGLARAGVDPAADAPLCESAARPHRGPDLWPRVAARLRQAAAATLVAGRAHVPA